MFKPQYVVEHLARPAQISSSSLGGGPIAQFFAPVTSLELKCVGGGLNSHAVSISKAGGHQTQSKDLYTSRRILY